MCERTEMHIFIFKGKEGHAFQQKRFLQQVSKMFDCLAQIKFQEVGKLVKHKVSSVCM